MRDEAMKHSMRRRGRVLAILILLASVALLLGLSGCKDDAVESASAESPGSEASAPSEPAGGGGDEAAGAQAGADEGGAAPQDAPQKEEPVSARVTLETHRPLLDEAPRAELWAGGLLIDMGTADVHKYVQGGWGNSWGNNGVDDEDGSTYTPVWRLKQEMDFFVPEGTAPVRELVLRVKSRCPDQIMSVRFDGESFAEPHLKKGWQEVRLAVPPERGALSPGRHELGFLFSRSCSQGRKTAFFDSVWLAHEAGVEVPPLGSRRDTLTLGGKARRALVAPTPRTYAFYLHVPDDGAELVFDHGSSAPDTAFVVRATSDDKPTQELGRFAAKAEWQEARVDLKDFAGLAVRLELETTGSAGTVGWGEPELMVTPRARPQIEALGEQTARHVVVLVIDTQRADSFEPIGGEGSPVHTPSFDALTRESTVFTQAYTNENWTKPATATILSGLYPDTHGAKRDPDVLSSDVELLGERLRAAGFRTGARIANGFVSRKFGFDQGWDDYHNYIRQGGLFTAKHVFDDAIAWVDETTAADPSKRFFLYLQTIDPHVTYEVGREYSKRYFPEPYNGPVGYRVKGDALAKFSGDHKTLSARDYDWIRALYNGEVTFHDEHMGRFVEHLRTTGLLDETLFIITNDHGEELDDHGKLGHGHSLYEELVRAPLLMRFPTRFPAAHQVHEPVETVDIAPTVLDVLGLTPSQEHEALSLLPLVEGTPIQRPLYALSDFLDHRKAIRVGRWKLHRSPSGKASLYDLGADPGEKTDRIKTAPIARQLCEIYLAEALANRDKRRRLLDTRSERSFETGVVEMDPELKKQLEALGYFGASPHSAGKTEALDESDESELEDLHEVDEALEAAEEAHDHAHDAPDPSEAVGDE